jgi:metallo-beta-lactamase class B
MRNAAFALAATLVPALAAAGSESRLQPDPPKRCESCAEWNSPHAPFRVYGNTYYVGVAGLSAILVVSDRGLVLLDGGLAQSAPLIDANIRALGFRTEDVRLIVNSHAHFDHAGGIAALARASGAEVAASPAGAKAIEGGLPPEDDPQYGLGRETMSFPAVRHVRSVRDGETLRVGDVSITAHFTPGHTPGSTTWAWRSCEAERCLDVVYGDSLNAISAPGFRFTGDGTHPSLEASFRKSIATVEALPCDVLLTVHPGFVDLDGKLQKRAAEPRTNPFVDPQACRAYAADARKKLDDRLAEERRAPAASAGR